MPVAAPAPATETVQQPAVELPAMAPVDEEPAVLDYFVEQGSATTPTLQVAPVQPAAVEPVELAELQPLSAVAPAPVTEPAAELPAMAPVELPAMAPVEPEIEALHAASVAQPAEVSAVPETIPVEPLDVAVPIVEAPAAAVAEPVSTNGDVFATATAPTDFRVVVRLQDGEGVEVGSFHDFGTAMEGAQEVIEQFANATEGRWPFYAGRFLRPDLIVSVDVVDGDES